MITSSCSAQLYRYRFTRTCCLYMSSLIQRLSVFTITQRCNIACTIRPFSNFQPISHHNQFILVASPAVTTARLSSEKAWFDQLRFSEPARTNLSIVEAHLRSILAIPQIFDVLVLLSTMDLYTSTCASCADAGRSITRNLSA